MKTLRLSQLGLLAFLMVWFLPDPSYAGDSGSPPDYSKPLFTRAGTALCASQDDLAALLSLVRTGQNDLISQVQGCMSMPVDGVPVAVLEQHGILDVWMRVRLMLSSEDQPQYWVAGWTLRNDDSPAITGDPSVGKVRVCLTKGWEEGVRVPAFAMFKNEGTLVGDLRDKWSQERYKAETSQSDAAFITTEVAVLSKDNPCAAVGARMFIENRVFTVKAWNASPDIVWDFDHVIGYPVSKVTQPGDLDLLRGQIVLRAVVEADIGNPMSLSDEDALKQEPENPLNQIPIDMKLAEAIPSNSGSSDGNFRVCIWKDLDDSPGSDKVSVTVPKNTLFESFGKLIGDLRDPQQDLEYDNKTSQGVITLKSFTVSKNHPCATTIARSVISTSEDWLFPFVRQSGQLLFSGIKVLHGDKIKGYLKDALEAGALHGTPTSDIGKPLDLGDQEP